MLNSKNWIFLFLVATTLIWGCDSLSLDENEGDYPVIIEEIPLDELQSRNNQYHQKNKGLICSTLNEYGYTGFSRVLFPNGINPCLTREKVNQELPYQEDLLTQVQFQISNNSEYTGIQDTDQLIVREIISLDGCTVCEGPDINNVPLQWKFTFEPQIVNEIEVLGTELVVYIDINGVNRIWGNWFKVIDPGFIEFGSNNAKKDVIGLKLRYTNNQNQILEQDVLESQVLDNPKLKYSTIETEKGLEIHKVWVVSILQENTDEVRWEVLLSTVTGFILEVNEL
jgi:hypothetical protein